jgi:hypothetical protein
VNLGDRRLVELRLETFNLFKPFNWGLSSTILEGATFGRIMSMTGTSRIMQFGKYGFESCNLRFRRNACAE